MKGDTKMRVKVLLSIFLIISLCVVCAFAAKPMASEFEEGKRIAMTSAPDKDGDYSCVIQVMENGHLVAYFVYYGLEDISKENKIVAGGAVVGTTIFTLIYDESDGTYTFEVGNSKTGECYISKTITEEEAIRSMSKILKIIEKPGIQY
jgi:hypothetical protein